MASFINLPSAKQINLKIDRRITAIADERNRGSQSQNSLWLENSLVAISPSADLVLFIGQSPEPFALLSKIKRESIDEYFTRQISIPLDSDDRITCSLILPVVAAQRSSVNNLDWTCLIVGYSSGYVRFLTEQGTCLLALKFDDEPVTCLKCQTAKIESDALTETHFSILNDEFLISYKSSLVILDGICLYENLRLALSETINETPDYEPAYSISDLPAFLNCKRWKLDAHHSSSIVDAELLGTKFIPSFDNLVSTSMNQDHIATKSFASSVAFVGMNPFLTCYKETIDSTPSSYKELFKSMISIWNKPQVSKAKIVEPQPLLSVFHDSDRLATSIVASPDKRLMVITDNFGRVSLIDATTLIIVRMWKGYRSAQCGWIQVKKEVENRSSQYATFLVIYAPKRDLVEIWSVQRGPRVAAFNVGKSCKLLYCGYKKLNMRTETRPARSSYPPLIEQTYHNHCFLLDFKTEKIYTIEVPFTYSLYQVGDLKYRDLLILRELNTVIDQDSDTPQISEIIHRLVLTDSFESAIERISFGLLPDKVVIILQGLINKTVMNYDNSGQTITVDDKSMIELCKRIIRLCTIFMEFSTHNSNKCVLPDINQKLIEEYEEHPDELDKFCGYIKWPASDVLRFLSLLSLDRSYRQVHDSNPWPALGEPISWSEFLSCFDLSRIIQDTESTNLNLQPQSKQETKHEYIEAKIKFNSEIKSLREEKVLKTSIFMFNRLSEEYYSHCSLTNNLSTFTSSIIDTYNYFDPAVRLTLLFQFWLNTKLCNHWKMWPFLQHQVREISNELQTSANEKNDDTCLVNCWNQIYSLIINSDNLFAAIIATTVIKVDTLAMINSCKQSKVDRTQEQNEEQTNESIDYDDSSSLVKANDWEYLCIDAERMSLLSQQLESLFLLSSLLKFNPNPRISNESRPPNFYKLDSITVTSVFQKGPTIVSELVAQWALQTDIALSTIVQALRKGQLCEALETNEEAKTKRALKRSKKKQIVGYKVPIQVMQGDGMNEEHVKELLHYTQNLFPFSLDPDILLINYFWESCQAWQKNPTLANEKLLLDKSYESLVLLSNIHLKHRLASLAWKTFFQWPIEHLAELIKNNPTIIDPKTKQSTKNKDLLFRKELNMSNECVRSFVQYCCDICDLILQLESEIREEKTDEDEDLQEFKIEQCLKDKLLVFDEWWSTPTICKTLYDEHHASVDGQEQPVISSSLNRVLLTSAGLMSLDSLIKFSEICKRLRANLRPDQHVR